MSKDYSYFNRLKPQKRKIETVPRKARRPYATGVALPEVRTQLDPATAVAAIGPSAEF